MTREINYHINGTIIIKGNKWNIHLIDSSYFKELLRIAWQPGAELCVD